MDPISENPFLKGIFHEIHITYKGCQDKYIHALKSKVFYYTVRKIGENYFFKVLQRGENQHIL